MKNTRQLLEIMALLRDKEKGCPWDLEQDFKSIVPHTLEEAYEVAEAIENNDMQELREELGDLLLQVVFYAQMAKEKKLFDFEDIATAINDKLIRRHPHIFGNADIKTADEQTEAWEKMKAAERGDNKKQQSVLDDVPHALPALTRAVKLQKRAARVGFDWPNIAPVFEKLEEEIAELKEAAGYSLPHRGRVREGALYDVPKPCPPPNLPPMGGGITQQAASKATLSEIKDELGDILFVCANLARHFKIDPEEALRGTNGKFEKRFHYIEAQLAAKNTSPENSTLEEMDALWDEAKKKA